MLTALTCNYFFLLSTLCNVVCGYIDPSNLISHCGRTAYIRSSRAECTEEKKVWDGWKEKMRMIMPEMGFK